MKDLVLIETYWNVNSLTALEIINLSDVLIETYWNVNVVSLFLFPHFPTVLIETYWNVNVLSAGGSGAQTGY